MIIDGKEYTKIDGHVGMSIEEAVQILTDYHKEGKLVCLDFNGTMLCSDSVTLDDAYKAITGMTKDEYEHAERARRREQEQKEAEYQQKIPELTEKWKEEGHKILDKKYWDLWDQVVPIRLSDLYRGMELGCTLDLVKRLNAGCELSEAQKIFKNQGHSGMSAHLMFSMLVSFCDRGAEFVEAMRK